MTEKVVHLNDIPAAGADLEDYVAALFQASGYFVEKNLVERDLGDILELDIVATDYTKDAPSSILAEAKGGKWGYPDIFKVVGWMKYLRQPQGAFFVKSEEKDIAQVQNRVAPLDITLVSFGDFKDAVQRFQSAGLGQPVDDLAIALWRHSNAVERKLGRVLLERSKSSQACGPRETIKYQRLVNDGIFFAPSRVGSLRLLYDAFMEHPKLTLSCAAEMSGEEFDPYIMMTRHPLIDEVLREGKHSYLQGCMYVEHRARIALLRAAVDICCTINCSTDPDSAEIKLLESAEFSDLPGTFKRGLSWLRRQPTYRRYALLWQQFLWGWGGFYLSSRTDDEFSWMSSLSGIPVTEIPSALQAFDKFFPAPKSWLFEHPQADVKMVKMIPMVFQGLGVYYRRMKYDLGSSLGSLNGRTYTAINLARWNNRTVEFLLP